MGREMSRRSPSRTAVAGVLLTLLVIAGGAGLLPRHVAEARPPSTLGAPLDAEWMTPSAHGPMEDEIEYYRQRLAERPTERFTLTRLFSAEMLSFRAFGDSETLMRASQVMADLERFHPRSSEALSARSALALARHDFAGARDAAERLRRSSMSDAATFRLFDALWATGERARAARLLTSSIDTASAGSLSRRARVLDADGDIEGARALMRRVVRRVDAYAEPIPVRAWARVELGHFELHAGDPRTAVVRFKESLEILPGNPAALEGLAAVADGVDRDPRRAITLLTQAMDNGADPAVVLWIADLQESIGNTARADQLRLDFIEIAGGEEARSALLRPLAELLADEPETLEQAERAAREDLAQRRDPGAWITLAWVHHKAGDHGIAWVLAERAVREAGAAAPPLAYKAGVIAAAAGSSEARGLLEEALDGRVELSAAEEAYARSLLSQG